MVGGSAGEGQEHLRPAGRHRRGRVSAEDSRTELKLEDRTGSKEGGWYCNISPFNSYRNLVLQCVRVARLARAVEASGLRVVCQQVNFHCAQLYSVILEIVLKS